MTRDPDDDIPDDIDHERSSRDRLVLVILIMVAVGGIVVTLISALIGALT